MSAATKTHALCISNGNQYRKFHPYPKEISNKISYLYPPKMRDKREKQLIKRYSRNSQLNIDDISEEDAVNKVKTIYQKFNKNN
jgi:hypothetical protein